MANDTEDPQTKAIYLQMAQVWFRLADEKANGSGDRTRDRRLA